MPYVNEYLVQAKQPFAIAQDNQLQLPLRTFKVEELFPDPAEKIRHHPFCANHDRADCDCLVEGDSSATYAAQLRAAGYSEGDIRSKMIAEYGWTEEPTEGQLQEAIELQLEQDVEELVDEPDLSVEVLEVIHQHDTVKVTISRYGHIESEFYKTNSHEDSKKLVQFYPDIAHYADGRLTIDEFPAATTLSKEQIQDAPELNQQEPTEEEIYEAQASIREGECERIAERWWVTYSATYNNVLETDRRSDIVRVVYDDGLGSWNEKFYDLSKKVARLKRDYPAVWEFYCEESTAQRFQQDSAIQ